MELAHRGVELYGKFCTFFAVLPSAYYCAARFPENFEEAILCSVNGGGQNTIRTSLVGALVGAHVGLSGIPKRFVEGLNDYDESILELAKQVAEAALERDMDGEDSCSWDAEVKEVGVKERNED